MAQEAVNAVVQALTRGFEGVRAQKQQQAELAERQREADLNEAYRKSELEHQKAVLDAETAQREVQNKANERLFNLQQLAETQKVGSTYSQTGALPAGASLTPTDFSQMLQTTQQPSPGGLPIQQIRPQPFTSGVSMALPSGLGTISNLQTPEAYVQQEGVRKAALLQPQLEMELAMEKAKSTDTYNKAVDLARLNDTLETGRLGVQFTHNKELELMRLRNQQLIDSANNRSREYIANLTRGGMFGVGLGGGHYETDADGHVSFVQGSGNPQDDVQRYVQQGLNGQMTAEDLKQNIPDIKDRRIVEAAINQAHGKFMTNAEKAKLQDFNTVAAALPVANSMYDQINNPMQRFGLQFNVSDAANKFEANKDIIKGITPAMTRILSGTKRYNMDEAKAYANSLVPDYRYLISNPTAQQQKYDFFVKHEMQDSFKQQFGDYSPEQQAAIRSSMNLPDFINSAYAPGKEHIQPQGTTSPQTKINIPQGKVLILDHKTGKPGLADQQYLRTHQGTYDILTQSGK